MAHQSSSTDYDVFIANMQYVSVTDDRIELTYNDCNSCADCPFNFTTAECEYSTNYRIETYHKLLNYISIHHPEKLI